MPRALLPDGGRKEYPSQDFPVHHPIPEPVADLHERLRANLEGRYAIERELGRGGMATVYLARDLRHDRPVALKVLHEELAARLGLERFQREIRFAARLQHPHILTVLDSGESNAQLWFTMPFVEGETLRTRIAREGQLPVADALRIAREAASALEYAHRHDVIHRDIKPENLLLTADGQVLVADFGIARALTSAQSSGTGESGAEVLTETGVSVGTPTYMSPEQASGDRALDGRTDVYSLGAVLYESVTGNKPFSATTIEQLAVAIHVGHYEPVSRFRADTPAGFADVLARALATNRDERYSSVRAFADALAFFDSANAGRLAQAVHEVRVNTVLDPALAFHAPGVTAPDARGTAAAAASGTHASQSGDAFGKEPKRSKRLFFSAVATLVALSALIAVVWGYARAGKHGSGLAQESLPGSGKGGTSSVIQVVPAEPSADSRGPEVVSVVSPAEDASAVAPVPDPTSLSLPQPKASNDPPKPAHKTRATQHGLAEDNPF